MKLFLILLFAMCLTYYKHLFILLSCVQNVHLVIFPGRQDSTERITNCSIASSNLRTCSLDGIGSDSGERCRKLHYA